MSYEINRIMDLSGVDTLIANMGLPESFKNNPRIKHTPPIDPLVFPFNNSHYSKNHSGKAMLHLFEYRLSQWKKKHDYVEKGLKNYLEFIDKVIEDFMAQGVVGFKFLIAYIRTTYFEKINDRTAANLYNKAQEGYDIVVGEATAPNRHPGGVPGATATKVKLIFSRDNGLLLGGGISGGESVGQLANVISTCIQHHMTAYDVSLLQMGTHSALTPSPIVYQLATEAETAIKAIRAHK